MSVQYASSAEFLASPYGKDYQPGESMFDEAWEIDEYLKLISSLIDSYCGRSFDVQEYVDVFEGTGSRGIMLRMFPVISLDAVDYYVASSSGSIPTSNFLVTSQGHAKIMQTSGITEYPYGYGSNQSGKFNPTYTYKITYTAGYAEVPDAIKQATLMLAHTYAQSIDTGSVGIADGGSVTSFKFGKFQETYSDPRQKNVAYNQGIPPTVEAILRKYKHSK